MKITFIDPPALAGSKIVERVFGCTYSLYPIPNIFSLSAAAVLDREGFRVRYLDMANERWGRGRFIKYLTSDDSDGYIFHSVNLSMRSDLIIHKLIRDLRKDAFIVFSGPAPTYFNDAFLKDDKTFVVRGEVEVTLPELMRSLQGGYSLKDIRGVSFIDNGKVVANAPRPLLDNLDLLPYPARQLLRRDLYHNPKLIRRPFTAIQTSRNCSYRCTFCVPNSYNFARELEYRRYNQDKKPPVRIRSAENVITEFRLLKKEGYKSVSIIDDQFLWDRVRTANICKGIKGLGIEWGCLARADHITEDLAGQMKGAGCRYVDLGVESFNQAVLDDIRKDLEVGEILRAVEILKRNKLLVKINLILGVSPLQTEDDIKRDIRLAKALDIGAVMFSLATPFPGTEFYQRARQNNWFIAKDYYPESVQDKAIVNYPGLSSKQLNRMVKIANLSFYFSWGIILKNLRRLAHPASLYQGLVALKRKLI